MACCVDNVSILQYRGMNFAVHHVIRVKGKSVSLLPKKGWSAAASLFHAFKRGILPRFSIFFFSLCGLILFRLELCWGSCGKGLYCAYNHLVADAPGICLRIGETLNDNFDCSKYESDKHISSEMNIQSIDFLLTFYAFS